MTAATLHQAAADLSKRGVPAAQWRSKPSEKVYSWTDKLCARVMLWINNRKPHLLNEIITEKSAELSLQLTMMILDNEGITHCVKCPRRFPLRAIGPRVYACESCFANLNKEKQGGK
jgi:hypothetical protein